MKCQSVIKDIIRKTDEDSFKVHRKLMLRNCNLSVRKLKITKNHI